MLLKENKLSDISISAMLTFPQTVARCEHNIPLIENWKVTWEMKIVS